MNNKGFTLVEIISVIALLGLVIGICVPSIMNASTNVKKKTLQTKVDSIEKAAILYGQKNREEISKYIDGKDGGGNNLTGTALDNYKKEYKCCFKDETLIKDCYYKEDAIKVSELVTEGYINYDEGTIGITNPVNDASLLDCKVQIYKKYNKIYAVYDKDTNKSDCWYE